ncbi:ParB/RepB/Spo0J family partition protein [Sneathiella glossodoripedis]|uniref:ParB/RepB/Spo0J family partition protein n=1 Tax=Sneathiella glossodoripedis TaxID=418853 RepID=UPI0018FFD036|nr:ParB/RepB/Spo0J family partition protein [Sneathiella glossodoripedis]
MDEYSYTQDQLAKQLGKSRSHIANTLRLLALPETVKGLVSSGAISAGAGRAILMSDNPDKLARRVLIDGLSVREIEKIVSKKPSNRAPSAPRSTKDQDALALEQDLSAAIGMKVSISHDKSKGCGQISIAYDHIDQLDEICRRISRQVTEQEEEEDAFEGSIQSALDEDFH